MKRIALTLVGVAVLGVAAIFIAKTMLRPAQEKVERKEPVLTGAYDARLEECRPLEDAELPESLPAPDVDEDLLYVSVVLFYPGVDKVPEFATHVLDHVNGVVGHRLKPVHGEIEEDEEGTYLFLIYRTDSSFENAQLVRDDKVLFDRIDLQ